MLFGRGTVPKQCGVSGGAGECRILVRIAAVEDDDVASLAARDICDADVILSVREPLHLYVRSCEVACGLANEQYFSHSSLFCKKYIKYAPRSRHALSRSRLGERFGERRVSRIWAHGETGFKRIDIGMLDELEK